MMYPQSFLPPKALDEVAQADGAQPRRDPEFAMGAEINRMPGETSGGESRASRSTEVWVHFNPTTGEAVLYDAEPPKGFGRRECDVGPLELDADLIATYETAKASGFEIHSNFVAAVRAAREPKPTIPLETEANTIVGP